MIRKLRLLLSVLSLGSLAQTAQAQITPPLFSLTHDTICRETEFVPELLVTDAKTYKWSFCNPLLNEMPQNTIVTATNLALVTNNNLHTVRSGSFYYSFSTADNGQVFRYQYEDGIQQDPIVTDLGHFNFTVPTAPTGTFAVEAEDGWHVFAIGNSAGVAKLVRIDFANGLNYPISGYHTYYVSEQLSNPRELFITVENDSIRAFTFDNDSLKRIDFGTDLSIASLNNFGLMGGVFSNVSGIAPVKELNNYHFIVTNEGSSTLSHVTFGNSFLNTPFALNLGDFGGDIDVPSGITIVPSCNDYYGFVINKDNAEWVVLHWPASIAGGLTTNVLNFGSNMILPTTLSNMQRIDGAYYMHVVNSDNTMLRVKYDHCTVASLGGSDQAIPPAVKYSVNGTYSVSLVVDEGLISERMYCYPITVVEYPSINLTTQDTLICSGDTIDMHALTFGTDSIVWSPDYNINKLTGNFVKVWPEYSQVYTVTMNFADNCILKKDFNIVVDKVVADAGRDREITDGSPTTIGGPNSTIRDNVTYEWTPDVYFETSRFDRISEVRPDQNMTYYLTVTSETGCKDIDSVWIGVPCEGINLPNAFVATNQTFGLMNLQLTQVNYFRIYDRWGRQVFSTTDPSKKWNGRNSIGQECEVGVYVWEIDAFCKDTNKRFRTSGNVSLLR